MNRSTLLGSMLATALFVGLASPLCLAQSGAARAGDDRAWVVETLRHYRLAAKARMTVPMMSSVRNCGQSADGPAPFKKTARTISR